MMSTAVGASMGLVMVLIYVLVLGISIYSFILWLKLARRGIRALDLYLEEKSKHNF